MPPEVTDNPFNRFQGYVQELEVIAKKKPINFDNFNRVNTLATQALGEISIISFSDALLLRPWMERYAKIPNPLDAANSAVKSLINTKI